jgi:signal transduction histidine kinase
MVCCSIRDDGSGFDSQQIQTAPGRKGLGLIAMQERVSAIGGTLRIESRPGLGTELLIQLSAQGDHDDPHRASR